MDWHSPLNPSYHGLSRPEIAALIPSSAERILDLGCGTGALGQSIKARQPCHYTGIEYHDAACLNAVLVLDGCYHSNLETFVPGPDMRDYDVLVCADILEHLLDPQKVLKSILPCLSKDATIIASIPNIAHPSIIADLQRGLFRYRDAGILDRTHYHHFTMVSIFQLFAALNLKITKVTPSPSVDNPIQLLITAKKVSLFDQPPPATIIIPSSSQGALLKRTIGSITSTVGPNARIIVINNALSPEITSWIEQQPTILEIRSPVNLGFVTAVNLGLEVANTPYVLICNDDIVVTQGWLTRLMLSASSSDKIGLVGPMSNKVSGPQMDHNAKYGTDIALFDYALKVTQAGAGQLTPTHRLVFFCVLIKKEVIDKIGVLDELFSPGTFDDDDFCLRATRAGFECVIDRSVFIHHVGSQTFMQDRNAYDTLIKCNYAKFCSKWGITPGSGLKFSS